QPFVAPVIGQTDLVNDLAVVAERAHAAGNQGLALDLIPRRRHHDPIEIFDAVLSSQLRTDLGEHLWHQLAEPAVPARHRARGVLLGHAIRRDHVGVLWIARWTDGVVLATHSLGHRAVLPRVEIIDDR